MITVTSSKDSSDGGGETFPALDKLDVYGDGPWTVPTQICAIFCFDVNRGFFVCTICTINTKINET